VPNIKSTSEALTKTSSKFKMIIKLYILFAIDLTEGVRPFLGPCASVTGRGIREIELNASMEVILMNDDRPGALTSSALCR
jgi:hypothetical protein